MIDNTIDVILVGVSAGFRHEASAVAVLERSFVPSSSPYTWFENHILGRDKKPTLETEIRQDIKPEYRVLHLSRIGPPTTLPQLSKEVDRILGRLLKQTKDIIMIGEVFSVGASGWASVVEAVEHRFQAEKNTTLQQRALRVANAAGSEQSEARVLSIGRSELMGIAQRMFDARELRIQRSLAYASTLIDDLQSMDPSRTRPPVPDARGGREQTNDDLVYALGCACFAASKLGREKFVRVEPPHPLEA